MIHRYILDQIDDTLYSTDSFEVYALYLKLFDYHRYCNIMYKSKPKQPLPKTKTVPANHETWIRCLRSERSVYERGFVPKRVFDENTGSKVVWVEDVEKAKMLLSKMRGGI